MKNVISFVVEKFFFLSSCLPTWVHYRLSDCMYPIIYYLVRYRRRVVERNISEAFPEKSKKEIRKIIRQFYHFFCDYIVETCRLLTVSRKEIMRRMQFEGIEEIEKDLETHDIVIVYLGHYCNWEWISTMPQWVNPKFHCAQLYRPLNNDAFDRVFMRLRTRFGAENIAKNDALRRILEMKRDGQKTVIGFISDQRPRRINIHDWVDFLHHDTPVFTGTERIAKKVDAAIFFADITREGRGRYRCRLRRMTDDVKSFPNYELTELYMKNLEEIIRRQPPYWLWTHKRWKHKREED